MTDLPPVMAFDTYRTNAELIEAVHRLGYLKDDDLVLDPTYGLGVFWKNWRPENLIASDLDPDKCPADQEPADFTDLPWVDNSFDAVVFDPPYRLNGTPDKWTMPEGSGQVGFDYAYGVHLAMDWKERMELCKAGVRECVRVVKPRGYVLVKCQDQIASGKARWQTIEFAQTAVDLGCRLVDMLHMNTHHRPQPPGRRQIHARRSYSTLLVLKKEK